MTTPTPKMSGRLRSLLLLALLAVVVMAPAAVAETIAVTGGDIYTISNGIVRGGTLIIQDGKIAQIGIGIPVPGGAQVIDAKGKTVLPGLVAAQMASVFAGNGGSAAASVDPYSTNVSFALAAGITTGYVVGGTNAAVKMTEGNAETMVIREPVDTSLSYSRSDMRGKAELRRRLTEAQDHLRKHSQWERDTAKGAKIDEPKPPRGSEQLLPLLRGEVRARLAASSVSDILCALELARDFDIHLTLTDVVEGWIVPQEMARYDVAVIMSPRALQEKNEWQNAPSGSSPSQAKILREAGIQLALVPAGIGFDTGGGFGDDLFTLPLDAAYAVGGGLDEQSALEAITLGPAKILGVDDRVGSLEVGKDADVIVMNGSPLHYRTLVDVTIVDGKVLYERAKSPYFSHIGAKPEAPPETDVPAPPAGQ